MHDLKRVQTVYLAAILDPHSWRVVGWAVSDRPL